MPELAYEETATMENLRYSSDDPYLRIDPVHTCEAEIVTQRDDW